MYDFDYNLLHEMYFNEFQLKYFSRGYSSSSNVYKMLH